MRKDLNVDLRVLNLQVQNPVEWLDSQFLSGEFDFYKLEKLHDNIWTVSAGVRGGYVIRRIYCFCKDKIKVFSFKNPNQWKNRKRIAEKFCKN